MSGARQVDERDPDVMEIDELAAKLGVCTRTIERQLRAGTFFIPELPKVARKHTWSRARVSAAIAETTLSSHAETIRQGQRGSPRKDRSETARERVARIVGAGIVVEGGR